MPTDPFLDAASDAPAAGANALHALCPDLPIHTAQPLNHDGQNSDLWLVNGALIFRFARYAEGSAALARETALLRALQNRLPLPIPNPLPTAPGVPGMVYARLPGEPFLRSTLAGIHNSALLDTLAGQIADFLASLHTLTPADLGIDLPVQDTRPEWEELYADVRAKLFPAMRPDAREQAAAHFERAFTNPALWAFQPVLRHGDFGPTNLLYHAETQSISGVIDFSSLGCGDPAVDLASAMCFGEAFFARIFQRYAMGSPTGDSSALYAAGYSAAGSSAAALERARFYKGTYAWIEALFGLRTGDRAAYESGMADYI